MVVGKGKMANVGYALFRTLFLFGLLTWVYVILIQLVYPQVLSAPLAHIKMFPFNLRVDVTGIVGFIVSAVSFFIMQLTPKRNAPHST